MKFIRSFDYCGDMIRTNSSVLVRGLLIVLLCVCLLSASLSASKCQAAEDSKEIVRKVAQRWIQVGVEQYNRGFFKASQQSLQRAKDYKEYLTIQERNQIDTLLEKTRDASAQREKVLDDIKLADKLMDQGNYFQAKAYYSNILKSNYISNTEKRLVSESLAEANSHLGENKKNLAALYNKSVDLFKAGKYEQAREGFIEVSKKGLLVAPAGMTAEDYLVKIDNILAKQAKEMMSRSDVDTPKPAKKVARMRKKAQVPAEKPVEVVEIKKEVKVESADDQKETAYIDVINQKRNILKSHTNAVVNNAVEKANASINDGNFDEAKEAVETAQRLVNKNQLHLGDKLFMEYTEKLSKLHDQVEQGKKQQQITLEEQRRQESIQAQKLRREKMEADRQKRIEELMENSNAYLEQQRYDEALGQLESLLAIDPLNNDALILKQTLEDTINFREQLKLKKESEQQRADLLFKTDESAIPYANEITYPKDWREISARRKPEEAIGQDPANVSVYKQLDENVDLSGFTPDTSFSAAIDMIKKSVDPPLDIVVMWGDLYDNADIEPTTPINMDAIKNIPLSAALELLLKSVSGGFAELGYSVENGVIRIATTYFLPRKLETLVYDITDLLGEKANYRTQAPTGGGGGGNLEDVGGGFENDSGSDDDTDRDERTEMSLSRAEGLVTLIKTTIEPDTWEELGGDGTITVYDAKKLIVRQSAQIHGQIDKLLEKLRKSLGYQVAIEARFLLVGENFLEDIGLDVDLNFDLGSKWGRVVLAQNSSNIAAPESTKIPGTLAGDGSAGMIAGGYGSIVDDLMVDFIIRATQGHKDTRSLTAPKVTVINGESADLRVETRFGYAGDIEIDTQTGVGADGQAANILMSDIDYEDRSVTSGTILNVTPIISHDKKHVILNIETQLSDFLGFRTQSIDVAMYTGTTSGMNFEVEYPQVETSRIRTRVSVPDGGTLLLGGQKLTAEIEKESGVPVLSKMPVIGRAFNNRSKVKDQRILLILVKPTIILQEEAEADAIAAMEGDF